MKLQPLTKFRKDGLWLAVVSQRNRLFVATSGQSVNTVLKKAQRLGFNNASLMKSAKNYGSWAPSL